MNEEIAQGMQRRRILLQDGRYLIFYTFDGVAPPGVKSVAEPASVATNETGDDANVRRGD
jgi:hypothetical protein